MLDFLLLMGKMGEERGKVGGRETQGNKATFLNLVH
jgi:hypothetical protein